MFPASWSIVNDSDWRRTPSLSEEGEGSSLFFSSSSCWTAGLDEDVEAKSFSEGIFAWLTLMHKAFVMCITCSLQAATWWSLWDGAVVGTERKGILVAAAGAVVLILSHDDLSGKGKIRRGMLTTLSAKGHIVLPHLWYIFFCFFFIFFPRFY